MVLWRGQGEGGSFFFIHFILQNRYMSVYVCMYVCIYVYMHICICICICVCISAYIYIYIYMYMFITPVFVYVYTGFIFECIYLGIVFTNEHVFWFWSYDHVHTEKKNIMNKSHTWPWRYRKIFLLRCKWCKQKWICISIYLCTASFVCKR